MTAYEMRISDWSSDVCFSDLLVDQAEFLGFVRRHELVAIHRLLDLLERLARIFGVEFVHPRADTQDFLGLNLDVAGHALRAARRLVDHDPCVAERHAHPRLAGCKQEAAHRGGLADAHRADARAARKSTRLNSSHSCASRVT